MKKGLTMISNLPVPCDLWCPNFTSTYRGVFNVKVLVGAFNQEKDLEGAFSVVVKTDCETDGAME